MNTEELIEHQEKMWAARAEFNKLWADDKASKVRTFGSQMLHAELLAWQFFLRGKGLKNG